MRKFYSIYVAVATLCLVSAQDVTYKVIHSVNNDADRQHAKKMGVRVQGSDKIYILDNTKTLDRLVHIGTGPSAETYQYVVVNDEDQLVESEPFYRTSVKPSLYEFYGRSNTIQGEVDQMPRVDYSYKKAKKDYTYSEGLDRSRVHPMTEIPTFHIQSNPLDFKSLHEKVLQDIRITANVTRISSSQIEQFNNVKIELSGQTSRLFKKLSYSLLMDKEEGTSIAGYRKFKLRSCATDPSYLREKMYYDILDASDLPTAKASFIRLFVNEEPQGLYLVVDNYRNPFLKNVLGNNDKKYKNGALYQGSMQENPLATGKLQIGANLGYLGPRPIDYIEPGLNISTYKVQEDAHKSKIKDDMQELVKFIDFIHETESYDYSRKKNQKQLTRIWNSKFDVSLFLKHMAFEILLGHNDGYMGAAHNYMLYQDPDQKGRFVWLASDLDQTLGSTLIAPRLSPANSAFEQLDRYGLLDKASSRPLLNQLLKIKDFNKRFYQIFADIHNSLFKTSSISSHLTYLRNLIQEDVAWDKIIEENRTDNFQNNRTEYDLQINQKVLQLPLGPDFMSRINNIAFDTAIEGTIQSHPSITSLVEWFNETSEFLQKFVSSSEFKYYTE